MRSDDQHIEHVHNHIMETVLLDLSAYVIDNEDYVEMDDDDSGLFGFGTNNGQGTAKSRLDIFCQQS